MRLIGSEVRQTPARLLSARVGDPRAAARGLARVNPADAGCLSVEDLSPGVFSA